MTDTTWINQPRWHSLKHVDADFVERFQSKPAIQPKPRYENVRFQILRFAGRQAAAAVRIACSKSESELASIAVQAMLHEPFTYWDWQGYDAAGKSLERNFEQEPKDLEGGRRKKRLLWERERAFRVNNGEWDEYPTPRERFEGFKRAVDKRPENKKFVKRFALANWMTAEDLKWISSNLPQLEALDLSDVPQFHHAEAGTWLRTLHFLSTTTPYMLETFHDHFTYLDEIPDEKSLEGDSFLKFVKNAQNHGYRRHYSGGKRRPHGLYIKYKKGRSQKESESFEEFFSRLCERQERYEESRDSELSDELKEAKKKITETHMWRRLKWLGLKDWRVDSRPARLVPSCIPGWAVSLKTVSIRGEYTRDRSSAEVPSVHHHVCRLMIGIEKFLPESVTSLELRLSVPFLRYLLELLEKRKPSIKRVGIDLGAWVQIYPLRSKQGHLSDEDIRRVTRHVAHSETTCNLFRRGYKTIEDYAKEQDYIKQQPNFYRDRSGDVDPGVPLPIAEEGDSPQKRRGDDEEKVYSYLDDMIDIDVEDIHKNVHNCPIDTSEKHTRTIEELNNTRADTLPKLLEKLHLARRATDEPKSLENVSSRVNAKGKSVPKFQIKRQGAQLFALCGEKEHRSFDPINPLTLIQADSLAGVKAGSDYDAWSPNLLDKVYRWVEKTFQWRPVFDWDWFMVPGNMSATADSDLVNVAAGEDWGIYTPPSGGPSTRGKALQAALESIKRQFELLNDAGIPVHILIGRRDPDMSSCYWGWPYTARSWEIWVEQSFSANLEGIAEHVNVLSILYDLRNPLDDDRLALIESRRPRYPPEGKCPTRVCPFKAGHDEPCPFVSKYPALRNYHPRPQVKGLRKPPRLITKPGLNFPKPVYGGLANGDTSAPPTGEHADDHSKYDDSEAESREQWPLHLARRSVYARESVGWHRFWTAYATSFTRLTALRVRMPHSMDKVGSWHLARLINRKAGWLLLDYTSERQHIQTEEDLFRDFASQPESTPSTVYLHKKESRIWPAGRFVRRSWVWDPLELTDDRHIILTKRRESYDPDIDGDDPEEIPTGKKYIAYGFAPRAKLDLTYEDPNLTAADIETLNSSLRDVKTAIAAEIEALDPVDKDGDTLLESASLHVPQPRRLPHAICPNHEGKFKSAYGHHVKNVAGGQWREELREMISFADRHMEKLRRKSFGMGVVQESLWVDRERLIDLVRGNVPYEHVFKVEEGEIRLGDVGDPFGGVDGFEGDGDTGGENAAAEEWDGLGLLEGSDEGPPVDAETDSDVNSLFDDRQAEEPVVQTERPVSSSHPTVPDTQASTNKPPEKAPSGDQSGSKEPPQGGPFDTGLKPPSPRKEGNETRDSAASTAATPSLPPGRPTPAAYQEGAVRPTSSTIDENYSDEEVVDAAKQPAATGGVATSTTKPGPEKNAGKQVKSGTSTTPQAATETPGREDAQASAEADDETMTFMEWLTQKSRANAAAATGGAAGEKPGSASTTGKPVTGKTAAVEEMPSTTVEPQGEIPSASEQPGQPQSKIPPASAKPVPPTTAEPQSKTPPASTEPAPPKTKPKRNPPPTTAPAPPSKKPKPNPPPSASSSSSAKKSPPAKEQPSAQPSVAPTAPTTGEKRKEPGDVAPPPKRSKTQGEYVPEPTKGEDADGESSDGGRRKKDEGKGQSGSGGGSGTSDTATASAPATTPATTPVTAPSAPPNTSSNAPQTTPAPPPAAFPSVPSPPPPPQPTFSIQVPPKADGSGPDYNRITVKNLRMLAKERDVSLKGASLKAQIIRKFEEDDEENGAAGGQGVVG